jgi:hypothetical protein
MRAPFIGFRIAIALLAFAGCTKRPPVEGQVPPQKAARVEAITPSASGKDVESIMARMRERARSTPPAPGQKKFLWDYSGQTPGELIALEADHRIDSLVLVFEQAITQKKAKKALSQVEQDVLTIEAMEREVNNGGFHQFFLNSSRQFAPMLPAALERIGCPITARIASDALAYLQISGEVTPAKIREALGRAGDRAITELGQMDKRYFEYREQIADSLFAYLKAHRAEIHLP